MEDESHRSLRNNLMRLRPPGEILIALFTTFTHIICLEITRYQEISPKHTRHKPLARMIYPPGLRLGFRDPEYISATLRS